MSRGSGGHVSLVPFGFERSPTVVGSPDAVCVLFVEVSFKVYQPW